MTTLVERRHRNDLVQIYKIIKGYDNVNKSVWFNTIDSSCPGNVSTRLNGYPKTI